LSRKWSLKNPVQRQDGKIKVPIESGLGVSLGALCMVPHFTELGIHFYNQIYPLIPVRKIAQLFGFRIKASPSAVKKLRNIHKEWIG
jgi:hypothetical protein